MGSTENHDWEEYNLPLWFSMGPMPPAQFIGPEHLRRMDR